MARYLILVLIFLTGCEIFTNYKTVTVYLPESDPPWFIDSNNRTGTVFYPGISNKKESLDINWNNSFTIRIGKSSNVPIACYPSGYLKPAGAVLSLYPEKGETVQLNWEEGFLADLLLDLMQKELPVEHLNINKIVEEIGNKCQKDPWSISRDILEEAIIYNTLSVYKIKLSPRIDITLPLEGTWVSDNPFFSLSVSNLQGELLLEGIYSGLHRFRNPETEEQMDILVEDDSYKYLLH
jgi:hypothetical protein